MRLSMRREGVSTSMRGKGWWSGEDALRVGALPRQ